MQNPAIQPFRPAGVILTGGQSRRMGGELKCLLSLSGKPLLKHVIDRISSQVDQLYLSVAQPLDALAECGLTQVPDPAEDTGPLVGLVTVMQEMEPEDDWLVLVPCDAPFLPLDLATRLLGRALETKMPGAVIRYECEVQPTFSLWNRALLPRLQHGVRDLKMKGFKQFLRDTELAILEWPVVEPSPFFNINDPAALRHAGQLMESGFGEVTPCSA